MTQRNLSVHFIDHCARLSGGQLSMLYLLEDLVADGVRCSVTLAEDGPLVDRLRRAGATVCVREGLRLAPSTSRTRVQTLRALPSILMSAAGLVHEIRSTRPAIVQINSTKVLLVLGPLLRLFGHAPIVWSVLDVVGRAHYRRLPTLALRVLASLVPAAVVANSEYTLAAISSRMMRRPGFVVYPGVDQSKGTRVPRFPEVLRVVMLGRLAEWKGQDLLITAVSHMRNPRSISVDIIGGALFGEQAYEAQLGSLIQSLGLTQVKLLGFRERPHLLLPSYDILVHASCKPEAFGRVVAEGMSAGLAVVAPADAGPAEMIRDGIDGLLYTPGSELELAEKLDRLVEDSVLRESLGRNSEISARRYDRSHQVSGYRSIYRALTANPS